MAIAGGLVLFSSSSGKPLEGDPVNRLVAEHLVEERASVTEFVSGPYTLRWRLDNQRDIVYVAVTRTVLNITYASALLDGVAKRFAKVATPNAESK